jgi:WD40 repeat protein
MKSPRIITLVILLWLSGALIASSQTRSFRQGSNDDNITSVYFANGGKNVIASSLYDDVVMWDVQTGKKVWQFSFEGRRNAKDYFVTKIYQMVLSPDESRLALVRDRFRVVSGTLKEQEWQIVLVSLKNRDQRQVVYSSKEGLGSVAFSPDNQLLAWGERDKIHFWNVEAQATMPPIELPRCVLSVAFSPDSKFLAAGLTWASSCKYDPGTEGLIIFNIRTGERIRASFGTRPIHQLVFSPDSQLLIAAPMDTPSEVLTWNAESWRRASILKNVAVPAERLSLSADGSYLAAAFGLFHRATVYVWKVRSDHGPQMFRIDQGVWSINMSPGGETLAVGTEKGRVMLFPTGRG